MSKEPLEQKSFRFVVRGPNPVEIILRQSNINAEGGDIRNEIGDWLAYNATKTLVEGNFGKDIQSWAKKSYRFYMPIDRDSNDFLENQSPGVTFYSFTSELTNSQVIARYILEDLEWEIWTEKENQNPDIEFCNMDAFLNCFAPDSRESLDYLNFILFDYLDRAKEKESWTIEARFPCECYTHEMSVYADDESPCLEFGYWQRGRGEQPWRWKTRLKMIWDILTTGNPHSDMIILDADSAGKLRNTLDEFLNKTIKQE